jgi:hypothetical protein
MADQDELTNQTLVDHTASEATDRKLPTIPTDKIDSTDHIPFRWADYELLVDVEHFDSSGQAELTFWHDNADHKLLLLQTKANLLSSSNTANLVRRLRDCNDGLRYLPWDWILTCLTYKVVKNARQGEKVEDIWPSEDDTLAPAYLLEPLLYLNHPTVIFGDYGSLKSLFALVVVYVAQLPCSDNKLGLITAKESTHCLYCDYEDDPSSFRKRWGAIQRGFGIKASMPVSYRRMTNTLADSMDSLEQIKKDQNIKLLIVDSLGPAARGNLNDSEPAIKYHEALRKLGITSLTLAHNSKDLLTKKKTIFGSVFFTNLARSVWECKVEQLVGEDEAIISLKHRKANLSRLHLPLGYKFTFTNNSIAIAKTDLEGTGLSGELPLTVQIKNLLRGGAMSIKDIADALDANEPSIRTAINRMVKKQNLLIKVGESWGLKEP